VNEGTTPHEYPYVPRLGAKTPMYPDFVDILYNNEYFSKIYYHLGCLVLCHP